MRLELIGPNKKYELRVEESSEGIVVGAEGRRIRVEFEQAKEENSYSVRIDGKPFIVHIEEETESSLTLTLDGETVTFRWPGVVREGTRPPEPQAMQAEEKALQSPMAGKVISVLVKPGSLVKEGVPVISIESMKMESVIRSDRTGRIRQVLVKPGDATNRGQVLVRFS